MTRADIRERVRDYINESVASIWTDAQLNRYFLEELRSLPTKGIYKEELWTTTTVLNQQDYTLPTGTYKVESVELNEGTNGIPEYNLLQGVDNYAGAIYLPFLPKANDTIRIKIKKRFTEVSDDITALDIPDDKSEVLVWGIVIRAYKQLIAYYQKNVSWDAVTKPGDIGLTTIQGWLRDAREEYKELVRLHRTIPKPRDIDLVG